MLLIALAGSPASGAGAEPFNRMFIGTYTSQSWSSVSGNVQTSTSLSLGRQFAIFKAPNFLVRIPTQIFLQIGQGGIGQGFNILNASCQGTLDRFVVTGDLDTVTASAASVPCHDQISGSDFNVSLQVTAVATGDIVRSISTFHTPPPEVSAFVFHVDSRPSTATATISDGTQNFTPGPSASGGVTARSEMVNPAVLVP